MNIPTPRTSHLAQHALARHREGRAADRTARRVRPLLLLLEHRALRDARWSITLGRARAVRADRMTAREALWQHERIGQERTREAEHDAHVGGPAWLERGRGRCGEGLPKVLVYI